MKDKVLVGLVISTLFIKELWKAIPYSDVTYKMFEYSDIMITKQTYYWFFCYYAIQLIVVRVWCVKFPEFWLVFNTWFLFQILEVVEYYFAYNEPQFFILSFGITIIKIKYLAIVITLIIQLWIPRWISRYRAGQS